MSMRDFFSDEENECQREANADYFKAMEPQLKAMDISALLREAKIAIGSAYGDEVFTLLPCVCLGSSEFWDIERSYAYLRNVETEIGSRIVSEVKWIRARTVAMAQRTTAERAAQAYVDANTELARNLGGAYVAHHLIGLMNEADKTIVLWRKQDWKGLFEARELDQETYEQFEAESAAQRAYEEKQKGK